jgi:fucose 4-O-acetylase-like acetyltransferase
MEFRTILLDKDSITPEIKKSLSTNLYAMRGIAIILVVVGHVIGNRSEGIRQLYQHDITFLSYFYTFIYSFHMPIFFITSGISVALFSKPNITYKQFFISKLLRLFIPFISWATIYFILRCSIGKLNFSISNFFNYLLNADFIFWFFPTLIFASYFSFIFLQKRNYLSIYINISIFLFLISFTIQGLISTCFYFNMFYSFGYLISSSLIALKNIKYKLNLSQKIAFAIVSTIMMATNIACINNFLILKVFNGFIGFWIIYIFLIPGDSQILIWLQNKLVYLGKISMSIYLLHIIYASLTRMLLMQIGVKSVIIQFSIGLIVAILGSSLTHKYLESRSKIFLYSIGEART